MVNEFTVVLITPRAFVSIIYLVDMTVSFEKKEG